MDKNSNSQSSLSKFQTRKFLLTCGVLGISSGLLMKGNITSDVWMNMNKFTIGGYFASNVSSKLMSNIPSIITGTKNN